MVTDDGDGQAAWSRARRRAAARPSPRGAGGRLTEAEMEAHRSCVSPCPECDGRGVIPPGGYNAAICTTCFMSGRINTPQPNCPVCARTRGATA